MCSADPIIDALDVEGAELPDRVAYEKDYKVAQSCAHCITLCTSLSLRHHLASCLAAFPPCIMLPPVRRPVSSAHGPCAARLAHALSAGLQRLPRI